jgi:hypothetical protein
MLFRQDLSAGCGMAHRAIASSFAALLAALAFSEPATAQFRPPDDLTLAAAAGLTHSVRKIELNAGWTQQQPLWQGQDWRLRLRHEAVLGQWRVPDARNITELGYSPVLRLERPGASGIFFVEASVGIRLLSHVRLAPETTLSTAYQFADMAGVGMQWGQGAGAQTVGLRFQHQSNADIKKPNPGINFLMLYYRYAL